MEAKNRITEILESKKQIFFDCSDEIWGYAEARFATKRSADAHCRILEQEGFAITRGLAHMENAFVAAYGEGRPVIGILAEYDALGNMSQVADLPEKKYLVEKGNGHGCCHHALGAGALAGAVGIKDYMKENGLQGTIKFFGCPAEESGYGKAFMAKAGVFDGIDVALCWHPGDTTMAWVDNSLAVAQMYFNFKGRSAHAAAAPELGRSALDAAELMNVGVNFLREHIIDPARIHYAFMDAGGESANVVQPTASLYYFIRAPKSQQVLDIYKRVEKIAQGAALMTETDVEIVWDAAAADYIPNQTLTKVMYDNMLPYLPKQMSEEDYAYEKQFSDTLDEGLKKVVAGRMKKYFPHLDAQKQMELANEPLLLEPAEYGITLGMGGSTDVGDVSWIAPTAQVMIAGLPFGTPPHSWQWVAAGKSHMMHESVLAAGKTIAATAYDILTQPELLQKASREHAERLSGEAYKSIIPDGTLPR